MIVPVGSRRATTVLASVVVSVLFMTSAYADHVEPEFVGGNPTCIDLIDDPDAVEFRINNPTDGNTAIIDDATAATYVDPVTGFTITIDVYQSPDGPEFNFYDASIALDAVFVKGGPNGNLYEYDPPVTADTGLHSPLNEDGSGKWYGLSHISFCWVPVPSTVLTLDAADPGTTVLDGTDVTLTFAETNDGNIVLSDPTVVADNGCTPAYVSGDDGNGDLDPGETWLFECTVENVTSSTTITAIASGVTPDGDTVTWCEDPDNAPADTICDQDEIEEVEIDVIHPNTNLTLDAADPGTTILSGESVTLTFAESNTGDVELEDPTVTADNGCIPAYVSGDTNDDGDLDTDETWLFECTITPDEDVTITAIGSGVDPLGNIVTWCEDPDNPDPGVVCDQTEIEEVDIDVLNPSTSLSLQAADPGTTILVGESVTLTFAETNDGDVELEDPTVTADNGCIPAYVSGDTNDDGDLDTDETWLFECTITPDQDVTITAIASGVDSLGNIVTWCEDPDNPDPGVVCDQNEIEEVDIDVTNPSTVLTLDSADPGTTIDEGDSVTLTFAETNDGDVPLSNVSVSADNGCSPVLDPTSDAGSDNVLSPGETWLFTCTISPASDTTITAVASGEDELGNTITWCEGGTSTDPTVVCDQNEIVVVPITVIPAGEGCTPGFWKTHPESWGPTGFSTVQTLESVFDVPDSFGLDNVTLLNALSLPGGSGSTGAARTLLRAAVAALLNAAHPDVDYPRTTAEIIDDVNAALTGSRSDMLTLASELDADNNLGCPIS